MDLQNFRILKNGNATPSNNGPFPIPPAPGNHPSTVCLHEFDDSRDLI